MEGVYLDVIVSARDWIRSGHDVALVTVARTWGSSPRPVGAILALRDDGTIAGSVSGGCVEDDLAQRVRSDGFPTLPELVVYGISTAEAHRFGLPCGGTLELILEPLRDRHELESLAEKMADRVSVTRRLDMPTGGIVVSRSSESDRPDFDGHTLTQVFGPGYRLLVIGAGQIAECLVRIAAGLDFDVTVCEPRSEYLGGWRVSAAKMVSGMPDDVVLAMGPDARTAVIALTHDPKLDDLALMEALRTPAFYVAALGSRRNNDARRLRLREFDLADEQIAKLRGPAGLYLASKTPMEIAVSILAELIAVKNGVPESLRVNAGDAKQRLDPQSVPLTCLVR